MFYLLFGGTEVTIYYVWIDAGVGYEDHICFIGL